jgi:hypothetical protein
MVPIFAGLAEGEGRAQAHGDGERQCRQRLRPRRPFSLGFRWSGRSEQTAAVLAIEA